MSWADIPLAEAGATTLEIMAVTGHKSPSEVERYTRDALQGRLAAQAINRVAKRTTNKTP